MESDPCLSFLEHPTFSKEIEKFNGKHDGGIGFRHLKTLLEKQFRPVNPELSLSPKVLRRVDRLGANVEVYKVIMPVKGLRSGQCPRVCFRLAGNLATFLAFGSHIENYKDSELKDLVKRRIFELDPDVVFGS